MTTPKRIQRKRTHGWRKGPNTVIVTRPRWDAKDWPKYGNPYRREHYGTDARCVELFVLSFEHDTAYRARLRRELRGKDLAGTCPEDAPWCHANVQLVWANEL